MSVAASDIYFFKALTNNDLTSNGGRISTVEISDNVLNNLFPNVTDSERTSGKTRYRKLFIKNQAAASGEILINPRLWIGRQSDGGDYFRIKKGNDTDIQSAAVSGENWSGAGVLNAGISSGESTIVVDFDTNDGVFSGESVLMSIGSGGVRDTITALGPISWAGNQATFDISGEMNYNHSAGEIVATIVELDDLEVVSHSWVETSASGTYNEGSYPVGLYPKGSVTDSWTLTFSDATNFSVSGAATGSVGSGDTSTDFQPANGSSYYFKINASGWGGSWQAGDSITFQTVHSAKGVWVKQVTPAGTSSIASSVVTLEGTGESA